MLLPVEKLTHRLVKDLYRAECGLSVAGLTFPDFSTEHRENLTQKHSLTSLKDLNPQTPSSYTMLFVFMVSCSPRGNVRSQIKF